MNDARQITAEERLAWERDGVVCLRSVYPRAAIDALRAAGCAAGLV